MESDLLILGLAAGYHIGDVRPFLRSLAACGGRRHCVLFVSPTTRHCEDMAALGAEIRPFARPEACAHVPYNAWRYFLYLDYLRQCGRTWPRIMLTDVRDVIFQRPPGEFPWPEGLSLFLEDSRMAVADCPHMRRWIEGHLGARALQELAGERIICSGTTVGDHDAVQRYLELMTRGLLPCTGGKGMAGYDQGLHNQLTRTGALGPVHCFDNSGPVLTLGYSPREPACDENAEVLNEAGRPAVVVHQYDRHPGLFARIRQRYA